MPLAIGRLGPWPHHHPDMLQGPMAAPTGPKPVGDMPESGLEDRLQNLLERALHHPVLDRGNAQGTGSPRLARLGDRSSPGRARSVGNRHNAVPPLCHSGKSPLPCWIECSPLSAHRSPVSGGPCLRPPSARQTVDYGDQSPNSTNRGKCRRDSPDSTDTAFVDRRVAKPGPPVDPSPRTVPPSLKAHRFPALLRLVHGFPVPGLLRGLRPRAHPSPVYAGSLLPWQADENRFPCSGFQPPSP